jgi:DNA-binding GntR family transcriptional regulator
MVMAHARKQYVSVPIYKYLKDSILAGEFAPGEQITENQIASRFGSSRTPVRDAFRKLSEDGLLVINPNKSVETARYDETALSQLGVLRLNLDILSAKLAIHYGSNSDFLQMKKIATECSEAETQDRHLDAIKLDADFHVFLAETSKNRFLCDIQSDIWLCIRYVLAHEEGNDIHYSRRIELHFDIVDALMERDEKKTLDLIKRHILDKYALTEDLPPGFIEKLY